MNINELPLPSADLSSERLRDVARAYGIGTDFWGYDGVLRQVGDATLRAVLRALGQEVDSASDADRALADRSDSTWRRTLPPVHVTRAGIESDVQVHVPHGSAVDLRIELEDGSTAGPVQIEDWTPPREIDGRIIGQASFRLPPLPLGWHALVARTPAGESRCTLVATPDRLTTADRLGGRTAWGLQTQLYSVRSERSWGVGDVTDLRDLAVISAHDYGADFCLVNPLHAAEPVAPMEASPYLPTTRRFFNPLYIRVSAIEEYAQLDPAARARCDALFASVAPFDHDVTDIQRDRVLTAKMAALTEVHAVPRSAAREEQFEDFRRREGTGLADFALWSAIREVHGEFDPVWDELVSPDCEAAVRLREELGDRALFFSWLQWVLDQQLEQTQQAATDAGMRIGVVHDLAVGVHKHGADAWTLGRALAHGVGVGAPADQYNQQGQNWNQPPWRPDALEELGYAPFRDMLRTLLRHAGALRIDHILGLFRLWWIPEGAEAKDGCYVFYDHEAMIGILALEAERAGTLVIGEDLGTFEPWVRDYLADRGIMGTSILWFENEGENPIPPERYRRMCLASVNTHDLPPTAGYLAGDHVTLRARLGLLDRSAEEERALDAAAQERVLDKVRERGLLAPGAGIPETVAALHSYLAAAPSLLLGVSLVDCVGERRIQNQPGTDKEYANWRVPLADGDGRPVMVDDLAAGGRCAPRMTALTSALEAGMAAQARHQAR